MKLVLLGIGRLKAGPERELVTRYADRCVAGGRKIGFAGFEMREIDELRARRPEDRKLEEAVGDRGAAARRAPVKSASTNAATRMTSEDFARKIGEWRDAGASACAVVIGGPDGLDPAFREKADLTLAFGAMTWPHQIVRALAAEQMFRA